MGEAQDEESDFSLDGLPVEFGKASPRASDAENFPNIPGYRITCLLDQGGMGAVYRAVWLNADSSNVAIKTIFLPRFQTIAGATRKRFDREAELLKKLAHPSIVPILDLGSYEREYQSVPYFTMPWLEQGDMADALKRRPIHSRADLNNWVDSLSGMLEGLAVAHRHGIVHRDIKPRNIFVGADGRLLLGDFGLAKILQDDSDLTSTIGRMGTTPYAPPEQLLSAKLADSRADIYAIGVILHQFACYGFRPFEPDESSEISSSETDAIARWQRSTDRVAPRPSARLKHLSDRSLDFIVQKCLAYYPEHRYQSVEDLMADLRAWRHGKVVRGSWPERFRSRIITPVMTHLLPLTIGAAIVLTTVATAAWVKFSSLTESVSRLEENVGEERLKQLDASKKTEAILREELQAILPNLQGEPREYNVRRSVDAIGELKKLGEKAQAIGKQLSLAESSDFADRHSHWVIQRTAVSPSLEKPYIDHVRYLLDFAQANLRLAQSTESDPDQALAVSDLLRTQRLLLSLAWHIAGMEEQKTFSDILNVDEVFRDCHDSWQILKKSAIVEKSPALQRHLKLTQLEFDLRSPDVTPEQLWDLCRDNELEFSAATLKADGCSDLQPWYIAWYIFEHYCEKAKELNRPPTERHRIVSAWHELQMATPALGKADDENIVYLKDLQVVDDWRGDVLRDMGKFAEAKEIYDASWTRFEPLRRFYKYDPKIWESSEILISSLINMAKKAGNTEDRLLYYGQEQQLLREKLAYANTHPGVFKDSVVIDAKRDLATSLYQNARLLAPNDQKALLAEAESLTKDISKGPSQK